jgi:alkylation response protein AidB-like acyl-CoA dehydrogenase
MDFSLTEEQTMLKDSVDRFLEKNFSFEQRRRMLADRQPMSAPLWQGLAELGVLGVPFSSDDGGFGGGGVETMLVMDALGRNLTLEPYLATVVLAGGCVALGGADGQKKILLPKIIDGSLILAFAHAEPNARFDLGHVEMRATRKGNHFELEGEKNLVLHGSVADKFIVSARTAGNLADPRGVTLFVVEADEENLVGREYPLFDGTRALDLQFSGVQLGPESIIGTLDQAMPLINAVLDRAMAALCAEAVGVMDALHAATVEYLKTRQQFGQPIGGLARCGGAPPHGRRGEGDDRPRGALHRPAGDPAAWWHGHDRRIERQPLFQAPDRHRRTVWQCRQSAHALRNDA